MYRIEAVGYFASGRACGNVLSLRPFLSVSIGPRGVEKAVLWCLVSPSYRWACLLTTLLCNVPGRVLIAQLLLGWFVSKFQGALHNFDIARRKHRNIGAAGLWVNPGCGNEL